MRVRANIYAALIKTVFFAGLCVAVFLSVNIGFAQEPVNPSKVRTAYLYHFMRFIEWPNDAKPHGDNAYTICTPKLSSEIDSLELITQKSVNGQPIIVKQVDITESLEDCQILYLVNIKPLEQKQYIQKLEKLPVLSVGNSNKFLGTGGIITFNVQKGQVTFSVNLKAASEVGFKISANMLDVAEQVIK